MITWEWDNLLTPFRGMICGNASLEERQSQLARGGSLTVRVLGIGNHALGQHCPKLDLPTSNLLVPSTTFLAHPARPAVVAGRPHQVVTEVVESRESDTLVRWMVMCMRLTYTRPRDAAQEAAEQAHHDRASSVRRQRGGDRVPVRTFLAESRSAGNGEIWGRLATTFPPEDHAVVSVAATAAVLVRAIEVEEGIVRLPLVLRHCWPLQRSIGPRTRRLRVCVPLVHHQRLSRTRGIW